MTTARQEVQHVLPYVVVPRVLTSAVLVCYAYICDRQILRPLGSEQKSVLVKLRKLSLSRSKKTKNKIKYEASKNATYIRREDLYGRQRPRWTQNLKSHRFQFNTVASSSGRW